MDDERGIGIGIKALCVGYIACVENIMNEKPWMFCAVALNCLEVTETT